MEQSEPRPLQDWVLYVTNHFTHPVLEAQAASPRYHLARKLSEKGQKLLVFCPIGRHVGSPIRDFAANLRPKKAAAGNTTYLFPPVIVSPSSATTPLTLVMATLFLLAYLTLTRMKVVAMYSTTILVGSVAAVVRMRRGIPFVANYGDPDFARERGLARRAFGFCEDLVMTRGSAHAVVYVDEVIGEYVKGFGVRKTCFLPNGGYERGYAPPRQGDPEVTLLKQRLGLEGKRPVVYAGQISRAYKMDLLVPTAKRVLEAVPDAAFVMIGEGSALQSMERDAVKIGVSGSFRFLGQVPYQEIGRYLAMSEVGLQLLPDMCMGTKVLMYMSNRLPVISVGGWHDRYGAFLKNGENVILLPPDIEKLSAALIAILPDGSELERLGQAGWESAKPFSWDRHAEETLRLLAEACAADAEAKSRG